MIHADRTGPKEVTGRRNVRMEGARGAKCGSGLPPPLGRMESRALITVVFESLEVRADGEGRVCKGWEGAGGRARLPQ